jgi:hypothetical protein
MINQPSSFGAGMFGVVGNGGMIENVGLLGERRLSRRRCG